MAALMDSAVVLGWEASSDLGAKASPVAASLGNLPESGDWLIVSVGEAGGDESSGPCGNAPEQPESPAVQLEAAADPARSEGAELTATAPSGQDLASPVSLKKVSERD